VGDFACCKSQAVRCRYFATCNPARQSPRADTAPHTSSRSRTSAPAAPSRTPQEIQEKYAVSIPSAAGTEIAIFSAQRLTLCETTVMSTNPSPTSLPETIPAEGPTSIPLPDKLMLYLLVGVLIFLGANLVGELLSTLWR